MRRSIRPLTVVAAGLAAVALLAAGSASAADDSSFTSQSVPTSMGAGTRVSVSLTFTNTGTTSWTASGGYVLGSPNPANSATWQVSSVALPSTVEAGSRLTFSFRVTAPFTPGIYNFQWQLQHGTTLFGATSTNVVVKVVAPPTGSITSPTPRLVAGYGNASGWFRRPLMQPGLLKAGQAADSIGESVQALAPMPFIDG